MKKLSSFFALMFFVIAGFAQSSFPAVWEAEFDNKPDFLRTCGTEGKKIIGTTKKDICVLDGHSGKKLWGGSFEEVAGVRNAESQFYMEAANVFFLIDRKSGNDVVVCLDAETGKKLWSKEDMNGLSLSSIIYLPEIKSLAFNLKKGLYMVDLFTGKDKWSLNSFDGAIARYIYLKDKKQLLLLNYNANALKQIGSGFKNQLYCVDAVNGNIIWETSYKGMVETKRYASMTMSLASYALNGVNAGLGSSNILVDMLVHESNIFLILDGLTVIDLKTGSQKWSVHYDLSLNRGLAGSAQLYEAVAPPYITEDAVYIADFSSTSRKKAIVKYDVENGKELWSTPVEGRKVIIPHLVLANGVLVAQMGGYVNLQGSDNNGNYFTKWEWEGPFGLIAFDASSGKQLWMDDEFKNKITNIVVKNNKVLTADDKNFYVVDPKSGNKDRSTSMKEPKTGGPLWVEVYNNKVLLLCEDGLAVYNADGSLAYAHKVKDSNMYSKMDGGIYFLKDSKIMRAIDIESGKITGTYKYIKGSSYAVINGGKSLYVIGKKGAGHYKI